MGLCDVTDAHVGVSISAGGILLRARGIVFRHHYKSIAKSAGKGFRDAAVVSFE